MRSFSALMLVATALTSQAVPVNITVDSDGQWIKSGKEPGVVIDGLVCRTDYFGIVQIDKGSKNSREANCTFLEAMVGNWNANFPDDGMSALVNPDVNPDVDWKNSVGSPPPETFTTLAGYEYVVFHFGNGMLINGGGSPGDTGSTVTHGEGCGGKDGTDLVHGAGCSDTDDSSSDDHGDECGGSDATDTEHGSGCSGDTGSEVDHGTACGGTEDTEVTHGDECEDHTDTTVDHGDECGGSDAADATHGSGCSGGNGAVKGWWKAWYLGGESETFDRPPLPGLITYVGGFTSARYYNPVPIPANGVPDSGSTLMFLGLVLLGMQTSRSRMARS